LAKGWQTLDEVQEKGGTLRPRPESFAQAASAACDQTFSFLARSVIFAYWP
jgi:hypothetical protein